MGMVYQWKDNGRRLAIDAQIAGEELERIRTLNNGRLESKAVVDASRDADAPLHSAFEWDDLKAAEAHRVGQAAFMIRHIDVVVLDADDEPKPIRAFVSVKRDDDRSYTSVQHALSDEELRNQVIAQAWSELEAWRQRHAELVEFGKVFSAIDQARIAE